MEDLHGAHHSCSRKTAVVFGIVFTLSLIPLLAISRYDHASADDYAYGLLAARTWAETHSFAETLGGALRQAHDTYFGWQGTYSATFLMALQPAVFGENFYPAVPVLLILSLTAATLLFLKVCLIDYMGANRSHFIIISTLILFLSIQFMYSPVEGFFWYNGGIYYTFFYSLNLIFFSVILLFLKSRHFYARAAYLFLSLLLGAAIAGGNYTTALTAVILLSLLTIGLAVQKNKNWIAVGFLLFVTAACFIASIKAPGNSVRQASVGQPNALKAILLSFLYGLYSICNSTTVPVILAWLFLLPFLYGIARSSKFTFRHPFAFLVLTFCVYCAQAAPPFYALGLSLPERLINIIYYSYYLLILLDLLYLTGWMSRKKALDSKISDGLNQVIKYRKQICYAMAISFFLAVTGLCSVSKGVGGAPEFKRIPAGVSALQSLLNGDAKSYDGQVKQRILIYQDPSQKSVQAEEFSVKPYVLYYMDIVPDPADWRNRAVAGFYGKESVRLQPEPSKQTEIENGK